MSRHLTAVTSINDLSKEHHALFDMERDLNTIKNLADGLICISTDGDAEGSPELSAVWEIAWIIRRTVDALEAARIKGMR